tara:strand:- start:4933 stop:5604 length:672 start_codon:yes stop_codon:yes gene_type:complete
MTPEIIINETGSFVRTFTDHPISNETILKEYFQDEEKLKCVNNVFKLHNRKWDLYTQGELVAAVSHITDIPVNAEWVPNDNGIIKLAQNGDQVTVRATMNVSTGTKPWLLVVYNRSLYLLKYTDTQVYAAPLPNFFDDGKMCVGDNNVTASTLQDCVDSLMSTFLNASYNTDLFYTEDRKFLQGILQDDGSLLHAPEPIDENNLNVVSGRLLEIYEHAISRLS